MLNSAYTALVGAIYLACKLDWVMVSIKMADHVEHMRTAVRKERWTPIVESPKFAFPGAQIVSSDASASLHACSSAMHPAESQESS